MDARITKSRLANFLSYDWLKILVAVAVAVAALCVFFTTVRTRPRDDQEFQLYGYTGLVGGKESGSLGDRLIREDVFSYDILAASFELFDSFDVYSSAAYTARRAAGQGKAMFVAGQDYFTQDYQGEILKKNYLDDFIQTCISNAGEKNESIESLISYPKLFGDCEEYLARVFGENWRENGVPNDDVVREIFLARNGNDKRFRTSSQKEKGVALERARLIDLRSDYLAVKAAIDDPNGPYKYTPYTSSTGKTYEVALNIGGLANLSNLIYYSAVDVEGTAISTSEDIHFVVFYNWKASTDLRFESISLLGWLLEEYGA